MKLGGPEESEEVTGDDHPMKRITRSSGRDDGDGNTSIAHIQANEGDTDGSANIGEEPRISSQQSLLVKVFILSVYLMSVNVIIVTGSLICVYYCTMHV
jgi:hypothetical protein